MAICLNKNSVEYQTRLKMSGLSEFKFNAFASNFVEKFGRFPELDEIPNANSTSYVKNALDVRSVGEENVSSNDKILQYTKTDSIRDANIKLNNTYRDLEIQLTPLTEKSILNIKERPTKWRGIYNGGLAVDQDMTPQRNIGVLNNILERLANLYGIEFIGISNSELASPEWADRVADAKTTNAFIYNGDIYINTDNMRIDAPLHEMLHLILGSLKFSDPALYNSTVELMEQLPDYNNRSQIYKDRTRSDINEELFVSEFSKYLTGQGNVIKNLDGKTLNKIFYNMNRVLDTTLFGQQSVSTMDSIELFNSSLTQLSEYLGSALTNNSYSGTLDTKSAEVHRILANVKSDLLKKGELKEFCS